MPDEFPLDVSALLPVLDHMNVGVYVTDTDRRVVVWNRKAEEITGYAAADVIGRQCHQNVLVHVDKDGHELCHSDHCPLFRAIERGREGDVPMLVYARTAGGKRVPLSTSVAPLMDASGKVIGGIEVFRDESALVRDLEFARKIQRNLMPDRLPGGEGLDFDVLYYPHDLVGGDFYDVLPVRPGVHGVLLADVSGHGVSAALYTMHLKGLARSLAGKAGDPVDMVGALNGGLSEFVVAESFATGIYAVVDTATGQVDYVNAGHPRPIVFPADGPPRELPGEGVPLGIMEGMDYECHSATLEPGDMLLLYTDGVTEVTGSEGKMLDPAGLIDIMQRERGGNLLERTYELVKAYCADVALPDDFTLLSAVRT